MLVCRINISEFPLYLLQVGTRRGDQTIVFYAICLISSDTYLFPRGGFLFVSKLSSLYLWPISSMFLCGGEYFRQFAIVILDEIGLCYESNVYLISSRVDNLLVKLNELGPGFSTHRLQPGLSKIKRVTSRIIWRQSL